MAAHVADHERAALFVVAVVEEAVDARRAAGSRAGSETDVRAQAELAPVPGHLVVAAAGAAPVGRVGNPVEAQLAGDAADRVADPARLGVEAGELVELE